MKKDQEAQEADNTHANRILQTPSIKPIVEGPEADQGGKERQQCVFNVRHEADVLWEGHVAAAVLPFLPVLPAFSRFSPFLPPFTEALS